jgi:Na+/H+ antiporter NhaD/arsenite permease-like protein
MGPSQNRNDRRSRPLTSGSWLAILIAAAIIGWLVFRSFTHAGPSGHGVAQHAPPHWGWGVLPFVGLLSAIALLPLFRATRHWWEGNRNRLIVSLLFAAATLVYAIIVKGPGSVPDLLQRSLIDEYLPFIILLFCLYVISGGISLRGDLPAHPTINCVILVIGALSASFIGTTGASMLLIRPLLQINSERRHVTHTVVFFIFLVSNIGGCLLPIGDPPLFLGYLHGVPFAWTLGLWKPWAFCCAALLIVYWFWDLRLYKRESPADIRRDEAIRHPLRLRGWINLVWLLGVVLAVGELTPGSTIAGTSFVTFDFLRELVLLGFVTLSLLTTPRGVREDNRFNYDAILEVAALFVGIFITMQVPLEVLGVHGAELGLDHPAEFFWITGALSSVLDNAPTYLVFFQTANALTHAPGEGIIQLSTTPVEFIREDLLIGISLGAVFMGANTYIGNGPNFMVKSIAEQSGVAMPSFFGFTLLYAVPVLLPLFVLVTIMFLR